MSILYTPQEFALLNAKAKEENRSFDLILGSDGVYRDPDEHLKWIKARAQTNAENGG